MGVVDLPSLRVHFGDSELYREHIAEIYDEFEGEISGEL